MIAFALLTRKKNASFEQKKKTKKEVQKNSAAHDKICEQKFEEHKSTILINFISLTVKQISFDIVYSKQTH